MRQVADAWRDFSYSLQDSPKSGDRSGPRSVCFRLTLSFEMYALGIHPFSHSDSQTYLTFFPSSSSSSFSFIYSSSTQTHFSSLLVLFHPTQARFSSTTIVTTALKTLSEILLVLLEIFSCLKPATARSFFEYGRNGHE